MVEFKENKYKGQFDKYEHQDWEIYGLVCYGGLNRKNLRESESGSLMLKSYFYSILCQNDLDLGFSSRCDISRAI